MANTKTCTHIKVTGVRCGSPSLSGEQFCYFHQHAHRGVRKPPQSRLHPIAMLEDEESIQASLMEVINALMRNTIDLKRAELILRALHIAVKNARRVKFDIQRAETVREIPQYAEPRTDHVGTAASAVQRSEASYAETAPGAADELPAVAASTYKPVHPDPEFWERWERGGQVLKRQEAARQASASVATGASVGTAVSVGTGALARPASEASALHSKPTLPIPSHNLKRSQPTSPERSEEKQSNRKVNATERSEGAKVPEARPKLAQRFSAGTAAPTEQSRAVGAPEPPTQAQTPPRKPSASAPQTPNERKITTQTARRG